MPSLMAPRIVRLPVLTEKKKRKKRQQGHNRIRHVLTNLEHQHLVPRVVGLERAGARILHRNRIGVVGPEILAHFCKSISNKFVCL